jgi:NADPH-dependent curcumin reductase CurA
VDSISIDAAMIIWANKDTLVPMVPLNDVMYALGVGRVIKSKSTIFSKGDTVVGLVKC